ncbi:MAG: hypothetical protein R2744_02490 [Bacteroidales bacterium]
MAGVIPEGEVTDKLASTIDIFPTLSYITGAPLPDLKIDGVNIFPLMVSEEGANPRQEFFYYYGVNNLEAVRSGNWKLIFPHSSRSYVGVLPGNDGWPGPYAQLKVESPELYNLSLDPGERYNLFDAHPEIVEKLMEAGERARADLGDGITGAEGSGRRKPGLVEDKR